MLCLPSASGRLHWPPRFRAEQPSEALVAGASGKLMADQELDVKLAQVDGRDIVLTSAAPPSPTGE